MFTEVSSESCSTSTQKPGGVSQIPRIRYPRMRLSTTGCRDFIYFLWHPFCLCFVYVSTVLVPPSDYWNSVAVGLVT